MNWPWTILKAAATGVNLAAGKIPLRPAPKTRRVRFADVPIHGVFTKAGMPDDRWRKVSTDEACIVGDPAWMDHTARYGFNNPDEPVDLSEEHN